MAAWAPPRRAAHGACADPTGGDPSSKAPLEFALHGLACCDVRPKSPRIDECVDRAM